MLKIIFLSFLVFLVSCGGGGSSVALNSQPETITFKTVPDNIGIFN